ncbi:hypothetical protein SBV1_690028 [Verrucomicrobia bacterium]|nr:hypothetical protein SBV1_690028 [Verrucomicrobiota bacterium]
MRVFIEAEKEKLTKNLTLNLRCHRNVWSVRQWSLGSPLGSPGLPLVPRKDPHSVT